MKNKPATRKQFAAAIFTALLSPMMRVLPRAAVTPAGAGAWLSVIPALPALLLLSALMTDLRRAAGTGEGMANTILRFLGPVFGRMLLLLYAAWFLFYAGFILRRGAERLTAAVYQQSGADPFILALLALCLLTALGAFRAAARTAVLLQSILFFALGLVCLFSLPNLSAKNLLPLSLSDAPGIACGALPVVTVGGVAALFSFLNAYVEPEDRPVRFIARPLALFSVVAALICFETVGTFGAALTERLSYPFFTMIRDLSLFHKARRIEAVVIALWVFADYILCTLLLRCAHEALRTILGLPKSDGLPAFAMGSGRWLYPLEAAAVFLAGHFLAPSSSWFSLLSERIVPLVMNCFVFGGFGLIWLVGKLRKKI